MPSEELGFAGTLEAPKPYQFHIVYCLRLAGGYQGSRVIYVFHIHRGLGETYQYMIIMLTKGYLIYMLSHPFNTRL